jgi:hypothetical protein
LINSDPFTQRRLIRFVEDFRQSSGQLPTLNDFAAAGFDRILVELSVKNKILEQFYVTLTNGTIMKSYKLKTT